MDRMPAECFHIADMIQDELDAREWGLEDLAAEMDGNFGNNLLALQTIWSVHDVGLLLGDYGKSISKALGLDIDLVDNLDRAWREWMGAKNLTRQEPPQNVIYAVNKSAPITPSP